MDTIRTLSELNALFADNDSEGISPQDLRDLMISQMVHGELGSGAKSAIVLDSGWNKIILDTAGVISRGVVLDTANSRITDIPCNLKAVITCEIIFKGTTGNNYDFAVWRNAATTDPDRLTFLNRTLHVVAAAQTVAHSWSTAVQLLEGDTIEFAVNSGTNSFEVLFAMLRLQRIGVE